MGDEDGTFLILFSLFFSLLLFLGDLYDTHWNACNVLTILEALLKYLSWMCAGRYLVLDNPNSESIHEPSLSLAYCSLLA